MNRFAKAFGALAFIGVLAAGPAAHAQGGSTTTGTGVDTTPSSGGGGGGGGGGSTCAPLTLTQAPRSQPAYYGVNVQLIGQVTNCSAAALNSYLRFDDVTVASACPLASWSMAVVSLNPGAKSAFNTSRFTWCSERSHTIQASLIDGTTQAVLATAVTTYVI